MINDFSVSMLVTISAAFIGFGLWLVAFLSGWGIDAEAYFLGFGFAGLACGVSIFIANAVLRKVDAKEGEEL
jgi:hypothetical protein